MHEPQRGIRLTASPQSGMTPLEIMMGLILPAAMHVIWEYERGRP
jgi:hypothetical protein